MSMRKFLIGGATALATVALMLQGCGNNNGGGGGGGGSGSTPSTTRELAIQEINNSTRDTAQPREINMLGFTDPEDSSETALPIAVN